MAGCLQNSGKAAGSATQQDAEANMLVTHSLKSRHDGSEDGTGRGTPIIPLLEAGARTGKSTDDLRAGSGIGEPGDPMFTLQSGKQHAIAFSAKDNGADAGVVAPPIRAGGHDKSHANSGNWPAVAIRSANTSSNGWGISEEVTHTLDQASPHQVMTPAMQVRRLTPLECERLQGFPDFYTDIPYRSKRAADGPRYKALGNSMAVPVMRWIGERINLINHD